MLKVIIPSSLSISKSLSVISSGALRVQREAPKHNNIKPYLRDHTNTYSIPKAMFRNQNYNTGQLRYFDNNLSRTSKQAEI